MLCIRVWSIISTIVSFCPYTINTILYSVLVLCIALNDTVSEGKLFGGCLRMS